VNENEHRPGLDERVVTVQVTPRVVVRSPPQHHAMTSRLRRIDRAGGAASKEPPKSVARTMATKICLLKRKPKAHHREMYPTTTHRGLAEDGRVGAVVNRSDTGGPAVVKAPTVTSTVVGEREIVIGAPQATVEVPGRAVTKGMALVRGRPSVIRTSTITATTIDRLESLRSDLRQVLTVAALMTAIIQNGSESRAKSPRSESVIEKRTGSGEGIATTTRSTMKFETLIRALRTAKIKSFNGDSTCLFKG